MNYEPIEIKNGMQPLDCDVYEASKHRIKKVIPNFDNVCVTFTAGKDSTAVLYLVDECMKELGRKDKVKVIFRDEEIMPYDTLKFVKDLIDTGKYEFYYYCLPTLAVAQLLGKDIRYVQWDNNREWFRQPPDYAITIKDVGNVLLKDPMYDAFKLLLNEVNGSLVIFNGYRADESYMVYTAVRRNPDEPYLTSSPISPRLKLCKPIYDWKTRDVFLYLLKCNLPYNPIYNVFLWCDMPLRSNIPLEKGATRDLDKYKLYDPDYYNQLAYMFPDVEASSRYSKDISVDKVAENYGNNPEGMVKYILEHIDESVKRKYLKDLKRVLIKRNNYLKEEKLLPFGGYPFIRIWLWLIYGNGLIEVVNYRLKDFLFEGFTERDYQKYEIDRMRRG